MPWALRPGCTAVAVVGETGVVTPHFVPAIPMHPAGMFSMTPAYLTPTPT